MKNKLFIFEIYVLISLSFIGSIKTNGQLDIITDCGEHQHWSVKGEGNQGVSPGR